MEEALALVLKKIGLIGDDFTGKVTINLNCGSVCDIEKTQRIK